MMDLLSHQGHTVFLSEWNASLSDSVGLVFFNWNLVS